MIEISIHEVKDLEHEMYNRSHYNRALRVFGRLRDKLLREYAWQKYV